MVVNVLLCIMGASGALRKLAGFLEECEREGGTVSSVGFADSIGAETDVTAEIELTVPMASTAGGDTAVSLCTTTVDADGTLHVAFESTTSVVPTTGHDVQVEPTDAVFDADGTITITLSAFVPTDADSTADSQRSRHSSGDRVALVTGRSDELQPEHSPSQQEVHTEDSRDPKCDRTLPPFEDTELLKEVYDSCETFAEMTDAIDMDVTAETVRRYMIDHGIHQPNSYQTRHSRETTTATEATETTAETTVDDSSSEIDTESPSEIDSESTEDQPTPVVLPDGIGLPEEVTVDSIIETVKRSNTIYEVTHDLDLDRNESLEMLRELNLLDLVVGRLATEGERDIKREDIIDRLREASAAR